MENEQRPSSDVIFRNIESQIRNNEFSSKEQLSEYLRDLKDQGIVTLEQLNLRFEELLGIYDSLHQSSELPLNMENYKGVALDNKDLIISTETDKVLQTNESHTKIVEEFKKVQNEMIAHGADPLVNADEVFNYMAKNQKIELSLVPLSEIHTISHIDIEVLRKISFFTKNQFVNPYDYKVDIDSGIFYNIKTDEVLEVRKNESTNQYEIYRGSELIYGDVSEVEEPILDLDEEEMPYEERSIPNLAQKNNKRKTLKPQKQYYNNAAFAKVGFLGLTIFVFVVLAILVILLNNK